MSQSMGWADNIILAMAPLGIVTVIVGAIRVGGPSWLKAIIGRARENRAVAEAELMSSTSHEVCELWNGHQIVRIIGSGPIREFIILTRKGNRTEGSRTKTPAALPTGTSALRRPGSGGRPAGPELADETPAISLKDALRSDTPCYLTDYRQYPHPPRVTLI